MRRRAVGLLVLLALLLGGCWDRREIEDTAYVITIGVDQADREAYLWTFRIVQGEYLPLGMITSTPPQPGKTSAGLISVRGASLEQALQLLQAGITRVVTLEQLRYVLFGAELARSGIGPVLNQFLRHNQIRRGIGIATTTGRAVDIFTHDLPVGEVNPAKIAEDLLLVQKQVHLSPPIRLQHVYSRMLAPGSDPITPLIDLNPYAPHRLGSPLPPMDERSLQGGEFPRAGGNPVESAGTAVFRGDRLVGTLTVDETSALLALRGQMGKVYNSIPDPKEPQHTMSLRFHQENLPQYQVSFAGNRPVIHVALNLEAEILSSYGKTDYSLPANRQLLERHAARYLETENYAPLIQKIYKVWGADPVGIGQRLRGRFARFDDWLSYGWPARVRDANISVQVTVRVRRFGLLLQNPTVPGR